MEIIKQSLPQTKSISSVILSKSEENEAWFEEQINTKWGVFKHSWFYYTLLLILLTIYGGKVCPFIEGQTINSIFPYISIPLILLYIIRASVIYAMGTHRLLNSSTFLYFLFEMGFLITWSVYLGIFSLKVWGFGMESLVKITYSSFMLGLFSVVNMMIIKRRYQIYLGIKEGKSEIYGGFRSLKRKFIVASVFVLIAMCTVFLLTSYKNFHWLIRVYDVIDPLKGVLSVFKEILFVIAIFMGYVILICINYATNLIIFFTYINTTIRQLFRGNLDVSMPVLSNDEFGILGENVRGISKELKEKKKLKTIFGKLVNSQVADILAKDGKLEPGGTMKPVVVLFSDIRNFTSYSENTKPQNVISFINKYLSEIVKIIIKRNGIVDKFMGDGVMALFGLENIEKGASNALHAALEMFVVARKMRNPAIDIGVGINMGEAIVGLVGSEERLDFTAIGDVVNTAARFESATKEYGCDLIVSNNMKEKMSDTLQNMSWKEIEMKLKGKENLIKGYGLKIER